MVGYSRLFAYDDWANRETVASLRRAGHAAPAIAVTRMAHVVAAERLWWSRLTKDPAPVVVWPDLTLSECEEQARELAALWHEYLLSATPGLLAEPVSYVNSKGQLWSSTVEEILTHVILHSGYHRGQIASDLRGAGEEPAYTDFIHAVRSRLIE